MSAENKAEIIATTKRTWELIDGSKPVDSERVMLPPGEYRLEAIPNPFGHPRTWLVLEGTTIGWATGAWKDWQNGMLNDFGQPVDWGEFEITLKGSLPSPDQTENI